MPFPDFLPAFQKLKDWEISKICIKLIYRRNTDCKTILNTYISTSVFRINLPQAMFYPIYYFYAIYPSDGQHLYTLHYQLKRQTQIIYKNN